MWLFGRGLMFKADGSFLVHDDAGGYRPLNRIRKDSPGSSALSLSAGWHSPYGAPRKAASDAHGSHTSLARAVQRSDSNAARNSVAKRSGSSHAAKWPPLSTSLK
jgi:hypothetical protein